MVSANRAAAGVYADETGPLLVDVACETTHAPKPLVLEAFVPFEREISVVVARNAQGEVRAFDAANRA